MVPADGAGEGWLRGWPQVLQLGFDRAEPRIRSPALRPAVFLLCCVALASGGAIGDRQEEEEAKADTVTVRMASWTVLWAGGQRDLGCLCPEENCVSDLYSSEPWGLWGTSLLSCHSLGIAGPPLPLWHGRGLKEVAHQAWTGCWSLVWGAALEGSMKWHWCVDRGARFGMFKKG